MNRDKSPSSTRSITLGRANHRAFNNALKSNVVLGLDTRKIFLLRGDLIPCIAVLIFLLLLDASKMNQVGSCFRQLHVENMQHPLLLIRNLVLSLGLLFHFGFHRVQNVSRAAQDFEDLNHLGQDILLRRCSVRLFALVRTYCGREVGAGPPG